MPPIDLQNLKEKILAPRPIIRDGDGHFTHPDIPILDEGISMRKFLAVFGIQVSFVCMEDDVPMEVSDKYFQTDGANFSEWNPTAPSGDGWMLLEIYDTEDGPCAMFGMAMTSEKNTTDAKILGVYRDPSDARIICVRWNKEPSDDNLRKARGILHRMPADF